MHVFLHVDVVTETLQLPQTKDRNNEQNGWNNEFDVKVLSILVFLEDQMLFCSHGMGYSRNCATTSANGSQSNGGGS